MPASEWHGRVRPPFESRQVADAFGSAIEQDVSAPDPVSVQKHGQECIGVALLLSTSVGITWIERRQTQQPTSLTVRMGGDRMLSLQQPIRILFGDVAAREDEEKTNTVVETQSPSSSQSTTTIVN